MTFYNPETKQAVIAYRGTEGTAPFDRSGPDFFADAQIAVPAAARKIADWLAGGIQKVRDITGLNKVEEEVRDISIKIVDKEYNPLPNQMYEAEDYARDMKKKYKDLDFSLTGHSLGGGHAQYAAAHTGMTAVTFSAPSVIANLPSHLKRKAEEGGFDSQIINYGHPGDFVASGFFDGYDRHVGSTYYINSNYKDMNDRMSGIEKLYHTVWGDYHKLKQYKFKNGYISNDLYDSVTGEKINSLQFYYLVYFLFLWLGRLI